MPRLTPCLWFDGNAEEAANFYVSVFPNSKISKITRWGDVGPGPKGSVLTVEFELDGEAFLALNGGPQFRFSEAVSFQVPCADQAELDRYWDTLSAGGETGPCGWLKDRFGLSWQVFPAVLPNLISDSAHPDKADRAMAAMMQMSKFDLAKLQAAYDG